jgi:Tol biopolymer transport system component
VNPDGAQLVNRTRTPTIDESNPVWSADGAYLAFQSGADGGGVEIMNANGSGRRRVADGFARNADYFTDGLAWAPDSDRLAIAYARGDIAIVDVATGEETPVGEGDRWLAWSASGRYLAWGDRGTIWVYDSDTGETFDVTAMDSSVRFLNWFPDEERLLFVGFNEAGGTVDLFAVNLDGSELGPVLETDPNEDNAFLSADGTRVLFIRGFVSSTEQEIALLEIGEAEAATVLQGAGPVLARWASDDQRAVAEQGGTIWLLPLDGSDAVEITEGSAPVWRPLP